MNTTTTFSISSRFHQAYHDLFYAKADPRIRDKFLMGDPLPLVLIYTTYVIIITVILPKFMKNRQPFLLRNFENVLNAALFGSSLWFFAMGCKFWIGQYDWRCQPIDMSDSEDALFIVNLCHLYLLSKFLYILESVLMSLRKNHSYMETYLLVHHTLYPISIWTVINYFPGGHATFLGFVNTFAHTLLFGYQLVANNFFLSQKLYRYTGLVSKVLLVFQGTVYYPHAMQLFITNDCNFSMAYPIMVLAITTIALAVLTFCLISKFIEIKRKKKKMNEKIERNSQVYYLDVNF